MLRSLTLLAGGALFGAGLAISGMLNPSKVAGFLDIFGVWDPSLAFVMGGGVVANFIGHRIVTRRTKPVFAASFSLPQTSSVDTRLIVGSGLFGIGWGLGGLCPGPAVASLLLVPSEVGLFVVMMLVGLATGRMVMAGRAPAAPQPE